MPTHESAALDDLLLRRYDEVLHYLWDPIGISDMPGARTEYRSYLPRLSSLLAQHASQEIIEDYLSSISANRMGLGECREAAQRASKALIRWREALLPEE